MTFKHPLIIRVLEIVYTFMRSTSSCDQLSAYNALMLGRLHASISAKVTQHCGKQE